MDDFEDYEKEEMPVVLVVDDDVFVRDAAKDVLGKKYHVITAESGMKALELLRLYKVSLILLDIMMPGMDGFETLFRIRSIPDFSYIPVMFLTGDENRNTEIKCLKAGAADFVRKPFVTQVLFERVRRIIELNHLQNALSHEVEVQTKKVSHLSNEIMFALSKAVDAKDHYTNGHSQRVAKYSVEIARRLGKSRQEQKDIYAMGLLHDVGKIGVSESIINKPSRLTDDEFVEIKHHTITGYEILKVITEMPGLATGARWHHERYDGKGYPDGLSGEEIPLEARIICVADCYDAMTSNRSYSKVREQSAVRAEIIRCRGAQFDPEIADIMVAMIDDDKEYSMSERPKEDDEKEQTAMECPQTADKKEQAAMERPQAADKKERPVSGKPEIVLPVIDGMDLEAAGLNIPNKKILLDTILRFYQMMPEKQKDLEADYEKIEERDSMENYRIHVHSLKSSSAMIGLMELSKKARSLEDFARDGDTASIKRFHSPFVKEWEQMYQTMRDCFFREGADGVIRRNEEDVDRAGPERMLKEDTARKTVLVIDDDALMLRTVKSILDDKYKVYIVTSGMKAMELMKKKRPDIIFLDYEMPVCNGEKTLEMIRENQELAGIPVVFLTGIGDKEHIDRILSMRPFGYLLKPTQEKRLFEMINKALG